MSVADSKAAKIYGGSGAEAYDLLLSESFDLLILDLNLPGMDGLDLLGPFARSSQSCGC